MTAELQRWNVQHSFGGALLGASHAKTARPFSRRQSMQIVLQSSLAQKRSLFTQKRIRMAIQRMLRKPTPGVRVQFMRMHSNGLQLICQAKTRAQWQCFLRRLSGVTARIALGAEKNSPSRWPGPFWDHRPLSLILNWQEWDGSNPPVSASAAAARWKRICSQVLKLLNSS